MYVFRVRVFNSYTHTSDILEMNKDFKILTETVSDFIFLVSKITADGDCSHEIKRPLLFGRKVMIKEDSILKNRDIILPTKVRLVKAVVSSSHIWM